MKNLSWMKAYTASVILHLLLIGIGVVVFSGTVMEKEQLYVIDLQTGEVISQGSGHAGGGGGSAVDFPEPLKAEDVEKRLAEVEKTQPVAPSPAPPAVPETATGSQQTPAASEAHGEGSGAGSGEGSGLGAGQGNGSGDGQGYGEGSGSGQGSGDGNVSGTGTQPFDVEGFWGAVNGNKQYPPMAIKRHLEGTVIIMTTLDGGGNCLGVSVAASSGHDILDNAAVKAAYAACPFPNASGRTVTVQTSVHFGLNE
ncbi:TonB family protein [Megasphaera vaginalis (ex Bordigoni et al. 2020)]|uniref:TonB family protein n=2 Tax=Megasphaera TaxID=906 RepID=UPI00190EC977|nr:TonB family protein [Megasphaera vaginalis (ex Bordigoni et al. 2020)]